jgi:drug/metabolite transporter (DMT)-like permease
MTTEQLLPSLWLIGLSIISGVGGQTAIKLGVRHVAASGLAFDLLGIFALILRTPLIILGLALYALGALAWIVVLSRLDLSHAYPFLALNFVLVALVSWLFLGESIPVLRWAGIGCICIGIVLVARSGGAG